MQLDHFKFFSANLTNTCMLRCKMCHFWKIAPEAQQTLPLDVWRSTVAGLAPCVNPGFPIILAGGEPLLVPDLSRYVAAATAQGFSVSIATNGYLLDERAIEQLIDAGTRAFCLSLDSLDPSLHDELRGRPDCHGRVLRAISLIKRHNPATAVSLQTIIMDATLPGLLDLTRWALDEPTVDSIYFQVVTQTFATPLVPHWQDSPEHAWLWPRDLRAALFALDHLIELSPHRKLTNSIPQFQTYKAFLSDPRHFALPTSCSIHRAGIHLDHNGELLNCHLFPRLGNVREASIPELLTSETYHRNVERILACRVNCHSMINCYFIDP